MSQHTAFSNTSLNIEFLGVGSASQSGLGHAAAVINVAGKRLLIDCGPDTIARFVERYDALPDGVFITHCHLDHVGDFENFFIKVLFSYGGEHRPKIFAPASIIHLLHMRVGSYPAPLAEGGINFWEAFQLIPVMDFFTFSDVVFKVIPVRHHYPNTAFGLLLDGSFFYTGDTRPIPEILNILDPKTRIFHDCSVIGNPSHTGIDDIFREYSEELRARMYFYHYNSQRDIDAFNARQLNVVKANTPFYFTIPEVSRVQALTTPAIIEEAKQDRVARKAALTTKPLN